MVLSEKTCLNVVIPVYNEEAGLLNNIKVVYDVLVSTSKTFKIILVNDGSIDRSWQKIQELSLAYEEVEGVNFSRNFGKEAAVFAGLRECSAECVVVMDADLQHPPELIPQMLKDWEEGYMVVEAVKRERVDSWWSRTRANAFNIILQKMTGLDLKNSSDFKLIDKQVLSNILLLNEVNTFYRAMVTWAGFPVKKIEFDVNEREESESKFSVTALINLALHGIVSFSSIPLQLVSLLGFVFLILSILLGAQTLYNFVIGTALSGFTTVILLILIQGSFIMLGMGILGIYVSKIYSEVKGRPQYIILNRTNAEK